MTALLSDRSPSRSLLALAMLFLLTFIWGKALIRASFILLDIFLILSASSERVVMTTKITSLKKEEYMGSRIFSDFFLSSRVKNLVKTSSHYNAWKLIYVLMFYLTRRRIISKISWAESLLNFDDILPWIANLSLNTCKNFFRHSSALLLRLLQESSNNRKTCLKNKGISKDISNCGTS